MLTLLFLALVQVLLSSGEYKCEGTTPMGKYQLFLDVQVRGNIYDLIWHDNMVQAQGFGVRNGDNLAVIYRTILGEFGVSNYKLSPGRLDGMWSIGDGEIYPEVCILADLREA